MNRRDTLLDRPRRWMRLLPQAEPLLVTLRPDQLDALRRSEDRPDLLEFAPGRRLSLALASDPGRSEKLIFHLGIATLFGPYLQREGIAVTVPRWRQADIRRHRATATHTTGTVATIHETQSNPLRHAAGDRLRRDLQRRRPVLVPGQPLLEGGGAPRPQNGALTCRDRPRAEPVHPAFILELFGLPRRRCAQGAKNPASFNSALSNVATRSHPRAAERSRIR